MKASSDWLKQNKYIADKNGVFKKITNMSGVKPKKEKVVKIPKFSKEKSEIYNVLLKTFGNQLELEYCGIPGRKFRFDYCIPSLKLAIEYEGLFSEKSRHTSLTGYSKDTEKYNLCTIHGWRVLRYTAMTYKNLGKDILAIV